MKDKNVMTKRFAYEYNELDTVAEFLEEKAAEGWELTSKTGIYFGFRKCNPKKVKVSVELVYADQNDSERARFVEYCEACGWKHIFSDGKVQIFESADLHIDPIQSDPEVKLQTIHKKCRSSRIILPLVAIALIGAVAKIILFPIQAVTLLSWNGLLPIIGLPLMGVMMIVYMGQYCLWYKKAKGIVSTGNHPEYKRTKITAFADKAMLIYIFLGMWGSIMLDSIYSGNQRQIVVFGSCFGVVLLFMALFPLLSAKYTKDRSGNFPFYIVCAVLVVIVTTAVQFIFIADAEDATADDMPLTLAELGIDPEEDTEFWKSKEGTPFAKSIFASETIQRDYPEEDEFVDELVELEGMNYCIYDTKYPKAYNLLLEDCFDSYVDDYEVIEEPAFGANSVYYSKSEEQWLLLYDERIITFSCSENLNDGQKRIVAEKLNIEL